MLPAVCNTAASEVLANITFASTLPYHQLKYEDVTIRRALLVGGGPSVLSCIETIRCEQDAGSAIFAMNGSRAMLEAAGISADYLVLADSRPETADFVGPADTYLISSQCSPAVFDEFADADNVVIWHPSFPGVEDLPSDRERLLIGGGSSVGILTMTLAYVLGFRDMVLFGYDSSYAGREGHAYAQPLNDKEDVQVYTVGGEDFTAAEWMVRQAVEFQSVVGQLIGSKITVVGSGLLPKIAAMMSHANGDTNASRQ